LSKHRLEGGDYVATFCQYEGEEFPDADFETVGADRIHKGRVPKHNTFGQLIEEDDGGGGGGSFLPGGAASEDPGSF
jgi:hypothetical protein